MILDNNYAQKELCQQLHELGLTAARYSWTYDKLKKDFVICGISYEAQQQLNTVRETPLEIIPAFSSSELIEALPDGYFTARSKGVYSVTTIRKIDQHFRPYAVPGTTEANARAQMLIELLERNILKAEDLNEYLKAND